MKKGFTLIELLAVIIILSVVSLIAMPIVIDVINDSKLSANKSSAYNLLDAANLYYTESLLDPSMALNVNSVNNIYDGITVSGNKPSGGKLYVNSNGLTALSVIMDGKCYIKEFAGDLQVLNVDNCDLGYVGNDIVKPSVSITTTAIKNNDWYKENLYMNILVIDEEGGSGSNSYKYCIDSIECEPNYTVDSNEGSSYITTERINYLCVVGYDLSGNSSLKKCEIIKLDKTAPEFSGIEDVTLNKDESIDLTSGVSVLDSLSGVDGIYTYNPTSIDTSIIGTTNVTYSVSDIAGNNNTITRKIIVDAEAPSITFSDDYGWHKDNFYAPVTIIDNSGLGIKEAKWCISQSDTCTPNTIGTTIEPLISTESNNNRICVQATDNNKTSEVICSDAYKLDKTAPIPGTFNIAGTLGSNGWYTSDVSISANNGSDSLSGHDSSSVDISSITTNTTGTTITLTTSDIAGNTVTRTTTIKVDKIAPTIVDNGISVTINKGSSNLVSNYFTTTYSISDGSIMCNPINTSTLNSGSQVVSCTATGNNGLMAIINKTINVIAVEYVDTSGANKPGLLANMIPVTYNGTNWIYADIYSPWYNYTNKQWANAVILNNGVTKTVGSIISESDISLWYVWIPRYKYVMFNGNNERLGPQEINITFESGRNTTGTVTCTDSIGTQSISETCSTITNGASTYTHPAFKLGNTQLQGIWVGKFENSNVKTCTPNNSSLNSGCDSTSLGIQIKPNVTSWRGARLGTFYTVIKDISNQKNITGADSHMMKNMEWGAVTYLSHSQYGLGNFDIGLNNNNLYITGCGNSNGASDSSTCNTYNTSRGMLASTTGNIYGIYDMSGGAWEYVMGNTAFSPSLPIIGYYGNDSSGFSGMYYNGITGSGDYEYLDRTYTSLYSYDSSSGYSYERGRLGDATRETLILNSDNNGGWYNDYSLLPFANRPWFIRGGKMNVNYQAGIFGFNSVNGSAYLDTTSRSVLTSN